MEGVSKGEGVSWRFILLRGNSFLPLKDGEVVKGVVLEETLHGRTLLRLKGKVLEAETSVPLKKGEEVLLKVEMRGGVVRLRLMEEGYRPSIVRDLLLKANEGKSLFDYRLFKELIGLLKEGPIKTDLKGLETIFHIRSFTEDTIKAFINYSGILMEAKLKELVASKRGNRDLIDEDLKVFLLKLKRRLNEEGSYPEREKILSIVDRLLEGIEGYQLESRLTNSLCIPLPPLWEGGKGELVFKKAAKGPAGQSFYCILALDLGRKGTLVIWILMEGEGLYVRFIGDNKELVDHLSCSLYQLRNSLTPVGLKLHSLDAECSKVVKGFYEGLDIEI